MDLLQSSQEVEEFLYCAALPTLRNLLHALRKQGKLVCASPQNVSSNNDRHFKYFYSLSSPVRKKILNFLNLVLRCT